MVINRYKQEKRDKDMLCTFECWAPSRNTTNWYETADG